MTQVHPRTVLISGASRGLGAALVREFRDAGYEVTAGVRRPPGAGECHLDLTALGDFAPPPGLGVLVNNAGVDTAYRAVEHLPLAAWREVFETNVFGLVELTQRCLPELRANRGVVVNITSASLAVGMPLYSAYRASKAAVAALGESLAAEVAAFGVRVIEVLPGPVATDMLAVSDREPEAAGDPGYEALAAEVWAGRRAIEDHITPADLAARRIVAAVEDPTVSGKVACDQLGADLTGAPLPEPFPHPPRRSGGHTP
jgi:NAD(P)-dependent dehydrogenase (short-subunit alcohol dehydrogenase family)